MKELSCQAAVHAASDQLAGLLSDAERGALEEHLAGCDDCSCLMDQLRTTVAVLASRRGLYTLLHFLEESLWLDGDVMECGVWRGGSAKLIYEIIAQNSVGKRLHLFDSFEGMKETDTALDRHEEGDFSDTSLDHVQAFILGSAAAANSQSMVAFHQGWIPDSFAGLDDLKLGFVHVDLDLYQSILDTLAFVYPRLSSRGVILFDDYGFASCSGARKAVDEFFVDKTERPFALHTGQAIVFKR